MSGLSKWFYALVLLLAPVSLVLAGEEGEEVPAWFPMLEMGGVVLGLVISALVVKVYNGLKGGMIGAGFGKILFGVIAITLGIATNGLNELVGFISEFGAELVFELFIYAGLIFIGIGVNKIAHVAV
ncbi:MAG: hypothetical protein OEZ68_14480 [Gammaproteobacteria bacterium]|nr:hypothetical protein [Gammaproteobacteria bacterium]MDH5802009.1 hypothetical protein [Gammaproteobacteria bacterium]